jgi:hypothetical protein
MKFHLSITKDGVVSLWGYAVVAQTQPGEDYVELELTPEQERQIEAARKEAV